MEVVGQIVRFSRSLQIDAGGRKPNATPGGVLLLERTTSPDRTLRINMIDLSGSQPSDQVTSTSQISNVRPCSKLAKKKRYILIH